MQNIVQSHYRRQLSDTVYRPRPHGQVSTKTISANDYQACTNSQQIRFVIN